MCEGQCPRYNLCAHSACNLCVVIFAYNDLMCAVSAYYNSIWLNLSQCLFQTHGVQSENKGEPPRMGGIRKMGGNKTPRKPLENLDNRGGMLCR